MKKRLYGVHCFVPKGRTQSCIYAVVLRSRQDVVKLGITGRWRRRRLEYDNWNFAEGDGILQSAVYIITEDFIDLNKLESACLDAMRKPLFRGREWFKADLGHARKVIEGVLGDAEISWIEG